MARIRCGGKKCKVDGCSAKAQVRMYCNSHYMKGRRNGDIKQINFPVKGTSCTYKECNNKCYSKKLCKNHYWNIHFKDKLFDICGGKKCCKCGIEDFRVLQFDHINGGGRKELEEKGYNMMIIEYIKNPKLAKKNIQILCANCNWIKKHENNENRNGDK